ncbi:MAG: hypothetical protein V3U35_01380 [Candidatus Neomarinimicrobiota bacterium]
MRSVITALRGLRSGERRSHLVLLALVMASLPAGLPAQDLPWRPNFFIRFWDLHVNPMEFRTPLTLAPFDLKVSLAPYGGPGMFQAFPLGFFGDDHSVVLLDSTESDLPSINSLFSRLTFVYDLDIVKINVLHRLLPFSLLDVLVGVGLRTNQIPLARDLPEAWPQGGKDYRFAPVFQQGLVNLTIGYQRSERWYGYLQMARGVARGSVYRASVADRYLRGTGTSADLAMGIKLFRRPVGAARYNLGLELRYHRLDVPGLEDTERASDLAPVGISPIKGLQMRYLGLFFTFGAAIGGRPTTADRAKRELYSGDYISAESNLRTFLDRSAGHSKERRARKMLALVERLVPYQQLALSQAAQQEGRLKEALTWLDRAETRADTTIMGRVTQGRAEIGYVYLQHADSVLRTGNLSATDDILRTAEILLPLSEDLVDRYDSEVLIRQGHALRAQGALTAALRKYDLAAEADFSRAVEIDGYKVRVAEDLLKDAEAAAAGGALALALESLRLSRALDPGRKAELDEMISKIEGHLANIAQGEIRQSVEASMREARELRDRLPPTKPRIGLLVSQIEDILGPPDHVSQDRDHLGIDHQMWEYRGGEYPGLYYFEEYVLKRVEPGP